VCEVFVGPALKDCRYIAAKAADKAIRSYSSEPRGEGTEAFFEWMLSLYGVNFWSTRKGNKADILGYDFFLEVKDSVVGIQVKSSQRGVEEFLAKGDLGSSIVLLWVDPLQAQSKKALFKTMPKLLKALGLEARLDSQLQSVIDKANALCNHPRIKGIPLVRGKAQGFKDSEISFLKRLGLIGLDPTKTKYILNK